MVEVKMRKEVRDGQQRVINTDWVIWKLSVDTHDDVKADVCVSRTRVRARTEYSNISNWVLLQNVGGLNVDRDTLLR